MADIKQDLYGLEYSDSFSLQGIQEAEVNLNLTPAPVRHDYRRGDRRH